MKTALVRALILMSLATSLTGFAAAGEARRNEVVGSSAKQSGCASAEQEKKQRKEKKSQDTPAGQQDFERLLMGIYG